jgi:hypothetical protein
LVDEIGQPGNGLAGSLTAFLGRFSYEQLIHEGANRIDVGVRGWTSAFVSLGRDPCAELLGQHGGKGTETEATQLYAASLVDHDRFSGHHSVAAHLAASHDSIA